MITTSAVRGGLIEEFVWPLVREVTARCLHNGNGGGTRYSLLETIMRESGPIRSQWAGATMRDDLTHGNIVRPDQVDELMDFLAPSTDDILTRLEPCEFT